MAVAQVGSGGSLEVTKSRLAISQYDLGQAKQPLEVGVWIEGVDQTKFPPLAGELLAKEDGFVFEPDFPFRSGKQYVVRVAGIEKAIVFEIAGQSKPLAKVVSIFPTADRLPENVLKFYVQFSSPMRKGDIYRYVRVARVDGDERHEIELPFLEVEQELWSRDHLRLTLLIDPGRIKRGLKPREDVGPVFEEGASYELIIDGQWPDASGRPIGKAGAYRKSFEVVEADDVCPAPKMWKVIAPKAGTNLPLQLHFQESLDSGLLARLIRVCDAKGKEIPMDVEVGPDQTSIALTPEKPWESTRYQLMIDNRLEDLCGNSVGRPFDVDVFEKTERPDSDGVTQLDFAVGK